MNWRRFRLPMLIGYSGFIAVLAMFNLARDIGRPFGGYLTFYNVIAGQTNLNQQNPIWWSGISADRLHEGDTLLRVDGKPYSISNEITTFAHAYESGKSSLVVIARRDGQQIDIEVPVALFSVSNYLELVMPGLLMGLGLGLLAIVIYRAGPDILLHKITSALFCTIIIATNFRRPSLFWHEDFISRFVDLNIIAFAPISTVLLVHFALIFPVHKQTLSNIVRFGLRVLYAIAFMVALGYVLSRLLLWQGGDADLVRWLDTQAFYATWRMTFIGVIAVSLRVLWLTFHPRVSLRVRREGRTLLLGILIASPVAVFGIGRPLFGIVLPPFWQYFDSRYLALAIPIAISVMLLRYQTYRRVPLLLVSVAMIAVSALAASAGAATLYALHPGLIRTTSNVVSLPPFVIFLAATGGVSLLWSYQTSWQSWLNRLLYWERHNYSAVNRFAHKLLHHRQIEQLPSAIVAALQEEFQMQHIAVWLWHSQEQHFQLVSQLGEWEISVSTLKVPQPDCLSSLETQPIYVNLSEHEFVPDWLQPLAQNGEQLLIMLLFAGGEMVGLLTLKPRWDQPTFTGRDIEIIELIGQQASLFLLTALQIQRLKQVPHQITRTQEKERFRIAQELHDTTQQFLGRLPFLLEMMYDDATNGANVEAEKALQQCLDDVERNARIMRDIRNDLAPIHLERDFHQAVHDLIARFQAYTDLSIQKSIASDLDLLLSSKTRLALYRIIQQALDNIEEHANARNVTLSITYDKSSQLHFFISDDGVGFNCAEQESDISGEHFGINSMRNRAQLVGGEILIDSKPGKGVQITGWLPVTNTHNLQS